MGDSGNAGVALHRGCVAGWFAIDPFKQHLFPRFRIVIGLAVLIPFGVAVLARGAARLKKMLIC
jgi:hypothetical protein